MGIQGILGFLMIAAVVICLVKKWLNPVVAFALIPPIFGLLAGMSVEDLGGFIEAGMESSMSSALVALTSIMYFSVVTEAGLFAPVAKWATRKCNSNPVVICFVASILCMVAHLDGSTTSTLLAVIPTMLPIFTAAGLDPKILFLIIAQHTGTMNHLPTEGQMTLAAALSNQSSMDIFNRIWPMMVFGTIFNIAVACYVGWRSQKKGRYVRRDGIEIVDQGLQFTQIDTENYVIDRTWWLNLIVTIAAFIVVFMDVLDASFVFMVAFAIALPINYGRKVSKWNKAIDDFAPNALKTVLTILFAGVFIGVLTESDMMNQMAGAVTYILPDFLKNSFGVFFSIMTLLISPLMSPNAYISGFMPLAMGIAEQVGYSTFAISAMTPTMVDVVKFISPVSARVYQTSGMLGEDYMDCIKVCLVPLLAGGVFQMLVAIVTGVLII